jgi:MarR family transcriptional regulator, organic hydroperoxide resistance regulator
MTAKPERGQIQENSEVAKKTSKRKAPRSKEFLAEYLPFLLNRLTREMLRGVDQKFQDHGLTVQTWRVLAVLADRGTCGFGELARLTSTEPATLSRFVTSLINDGLVDRKRSTADGRTVEITLTDAGEARFTETLPWGLDVENKLTRGIAAPDILRLKSMLKKMFANIDTGILGGGDDEERIDAGVTNN